MEIMMDELWRPAEGTPRILVIQMGGCATFGERTIVQTPVYEDRNGASCQRSDRNLFVPVRARQRTARTLLHPDEKRIGDPSASAVYQS